MKLFIDIIASKISIFLWQLQLSFNIAPSLTSDGDKHSMDLFEDHKTHTFCLCIPI
jgi:hypothetical protein